MPSREEPVRHVQKRLVWPWQIPVDRAAIDERREHAAPPLAPLHNIQFPVCQYKKYPYVKNISSLLAETPRRQDSSTKPRAS